MIPIWIYREAGIVMAASVAEFTHPETLADWRKLGRTPELAITETVTLGKPLPGGAYVVSA